MDHADIATDTSELATPTVVDPAQDAGDPGADAADARHGAEPTDTPPAQPANRWAALKSAISDFGEGKLEPLTPPEPAEAATEVGEEEEGEGEPQSEPAKPDAAKPEAPKGEPPRFTVLDADGAPVDAEWPEGVTLAFKADGRTVEVTSFDQLVQMAQRAPLADRLDAELSRRTQHFQRELATREQTLAERQHAIDESEATILAIAFDDEALARVRRALAPYQSEEARAGLKAQRDLAAREAQDEQAAERQRGALIQSFWGKVAEDITAALPEYAYLTDEDVGEAQDRFYRGYEQHREQLIERYTAAAASRGIPADQAIDQAERDALQWLTEENLAATMRGLNDRYAARAGRRSNGAAPRGAAPQAPDPTTADAEARKHNAHVDQKLRQRTQGRLIRGTNGAPPAGNPARPERRGTFAEQMEAAKAELRKAGARRG